MIGGSHHVILRYSVWCLKCSCVGFSFLLGQVSASVQCFWVWLCVPVDIWVDACIRTFRGALENAYLLFTNMVKLKVVLCRKSKFNHFLTCFCILVKFGLPSGVRLINQNIMLCLCIVCVGKQHMDAQNQQIFGTTVQNLFATCPAFTKAGIRSSFVTFLKCVLKRFLAVTKFISYQWKVS
jgi:hypothetical protein